MRKQKDYRYYFGNRYEKYSIKKLKVGAASVLVGAGFLFGYNVDTVEADSATAVADKRNRIPMKYLNYQIRINFFQLRCNCLA